MKHFLYLLCLITPSIFFTQSQTDLSYYLPSDVTYNKNIPTPEDILGYQVGEWHVSHDKLVEYMRVLAKSSNRITIENRGKTFEDRPLILLTITSPENQKNIKQIHEEHIKATESNQTNFNNRPIIVYKGYNIHGNEPSAVNSTLLLAYYLASAEGAKIDKLLKDTVILLDPCLNPDGTQRFAYWANTNRSVNLNPDPNDREFREVWPNGRTNHFWFDMNRDWLPVQMPESKVRITTFQNWLPNVLTDYHEMGTNSTYFFQPGIQSRTHPLTPKRNQKLTAEIAKFHAKALDQIGSLYYSEENFDDFYYGKGSTYPDINGGIGILFEQGSSRGHAQESDNGILTFPFTIKNQFTTSLSTLKATSALKTDILKYQHDFFKNARSEASKHSNKAIIFGDEKDASKAYHLAEILNQHHIQLYQLKDDVAINGKYYKPNYSYVIPKNQKNSRLLNAMFEKRTKFQDSLFYDVSTWTLPLAFNVDYAETSIANAGQQITDLQMPKGGLNQKSNYAYLFEWHDYYSPKLLHAILKKGLRAKVGLKQFKANGKPYDYGSIMIPAQNQELNASALYEFLKQEAEESHVNIQAVSTGLNEGIDLGSNNFRPLQLPKVALLVGDGVTPYDAGEVWHLLDVRYKIPVTKLDTRNFYRIDLSRYNTIIIPNSYSALDKGDIEKLKLWVKDGGTLIAYRNTLQWISNSEFLKIDFKENKLSAKNISFEKKRDFRGAQYIGGAIFEADLDRSHPINFGYKNDKLPLFRNTTLFVEPDKNSFNNPITYTEKPLLSGYISEENLDSLKSTVPLKIGRLGRGTVVAFTDNTNFRAFWYGTNKLMMNAIFFRETF
jgi:hypothetical protein